MNKQGKKAEPSGGRVALVVFGMHRSGTSALTRVLSLRGADLPAHLMSANHGNERGYWEPAPIVALNDEMLDYFGVAWDDPFASFQIPEPGLFPKTFQQRAARLLQDEYGESSLFILKDPRGTLLIGFWLGVLARAGIRACPVVLARHFGEVAASLHARDKTNQESAALLYVAYGVEAALALQESQPTFLRYDQLLSDWRGVTDRIATEQGFTWPRSGAFLDSEVGEFLVPGTSKSRGLHLSPMVEAWAQTVWSWLGARADGETPAIAPLMQIRSELGDAAAAYSPVLAVRRQQLKQLQAARVELDAGIAERHAAYLESQDVLAHTASERDDLIAERDRLLAAHERSRGEHVERMAAFAELLVERDRLLGLFQDARQALEEASAGADVSRGERDSLLELYASTQAELDRTQQAFKRLSEEADGLRDSTQHLIGDVATLRDERDRLLATFDATNATLHATEASFQAMVVEADELRARHAAQAQAFVAEADHLRAQHAAQVRTLVTEADDLRAQHAAQVQALAAEADGLRAQHAAEIQALVVEASELRATVLAADAARAEAEATRLADALQLQQAHMQLASVGAEASALRTTTAQVSAEREDLAAMAAQQEQEIGHLREAIARSETLRNAQAADAKRLHRELDTARDQLRHARDTIEDVHSSNSWRLTAPLRGLTIAGRRLLDVSRQSLHRPKRLLALAPPAHAAGERGSEDPGYPRPAPGDASVPVPPGFERRKHPGLRAFLSAEFGEAAAADTLLRIDRFRLPVETDQVRGAAKSSCSVEEAVFWARTIARASAATATDHELLPDVSIVVPVYNQVQFTLACVEGLLAHRSRFRFEILIGDDASTDATAQAFAEPIAGLRHVRHDQNLGFVRNCNRTAALARGRFIVMLNNDTLVLPGWLDELIDVLEGNPAVGLAGSKLIYPDGRLQECGAIVWRDGSAWNFGRLDDPRRPEHNYLRGVDFVSGASIALPTALWISLGGFDEHFVPAYAEDADLAFRVRAAGLYTLVQPLSQVLHFEGVSSGTDLGQGAKAYQTQNLAKLYERWKGVLHGHRENAQFPELEKERDTHRRMLFIDHCTLTPNEDAGSLVAFEIMKTFRRFGFKVTFIPEDNFAHMGEDTRVLQRLGVETIYHPSYSRMEHFLEARDDDFDVILLHRFTVGDRHLAALKQKFPGAKFIFLACDLHYLRELREAELSGDRLAVNRANQTRDRELAVASASDAVVVYSEIERDMVLAEMPGSNVLLFPLVHDPVTNPMPLSGRDGVCFVGGYRHAPNADAIIWFADQVWPLVYSRCPTATLYVAGSHMTDAVKALGKRPGVEITGFVPDMESFLARRRVNIAPLRFGAGVKGKVAASLANGLPTVGTPIAAEGMLLSPGINILVAESGADFADCVVELLTQDERWREVSAASLRYASEVTSSASAQERIRSLLQTLQVIE